MTLGELPRGSIVYVPESSWAGNLIIGTKDRYYVDLHDEEGRFLFAMRSSTQCEIISISNIQF